MNRRFIIFIILGFILFGAMLTSWMIMSLNYIMERIIYWVFLIMVLYITVSFKLKSKKLFYTGLIFTTLGGFLSIGAKVPILDNISESFLRMSLAFWLTGVLKMILDEFSNDLSKRI